MFMQQGGMPMNAVRPNMGGGNIGIVGGGCVNSGGGGMPMGNFVGQAPNVTGLPGPLAFLEKTTSNIGNEIEFKLVLPTNFLIICFRGSFTIGWRGRNRGRRSARGRGAQGRGHYNDFHESLS